MITVLLGIYVIYFLISLYVLKYVIKIDKNWFAQGKAQADMPSWYKYTFWAAVIMTMFLLFIGKISFIIPITLLLLNDTFINYRATKYITKKEEQYYPYRSIIGNIILIIIVWVGLFIQ